MKFAANLSFLYGEFPFLDRFGAAAADGFAGVEYLSPYEYPATEIRARLNEHGLTQVLFNSPFGDQAAGERGMAILAGRREVFRDGMLRALGYAAELDCQRIHVLSGIVPPGVEAAVLEAIWLENLRWAADQAASGGVTLQIEPINQRDMPGYFVSTQAHAHRLVETLGADNVLVQMDLYHCQVMEGDVTAKLRRYLPEGRVGHLQIAGAPQRQEPDTGELRYEYVFETLRELGYAGWIGCEYHPRGTTREGLGWLERARS